MNRSLTMGLIVSGSLLLAGCKDDLTPATSRFAQLTLGWQQQLDTLNVESVEQARLLTELIKTPGLEQGAGTSLAAQSLWSSAANDELGLEVAAAALGRGRQLVADATKSGKLAEVNKAFYEAQAEVGSLLDAVAGASQLRRMEITALRYSVGQQLERSSRPPQS